MVPLAEQWLHQRKLTKAEKTWKNDTEVIQAFFASYSEITMETLLSQIEQWRAKGISQNTIVMRLGILRNFLTFAKADPDLIKITKSIQPEIKIGAYATMKQVRILIDTAKGVQKKLIVCLGVYCGMRISEILGLNVSDIKENSIMVHKTKTRTDREIPILSEELRRMLALYLEKYQPVSKLFPGVKQNSIQVYFKRLCVSCGVPDLHLHSLRHAFVVQCLNSDVSIPLIQQLTGHKSAENVMRYSHISPQMLEKTKHIFG